VNAIGTHSSAIFTQIKTILDRADLSLDNIDAIITGEGPGSYTGLRIAASAIKGLIFGRKIDFFAANTLASFAAGLTTTHEPQTVHSVIDARRRHLYMQTFQITQNSISPENEAVLIEINTFYSFLKPGDLIIGTGLERL